MKPRPKDILGRPARPMRYPVKLTVRLSKDAGATLDEMAAHQNRKKMKVARRAIMKDVYIYKAEKKKRKAKGL